MDQRINTNWKGYKNLLVLSIGWLLLYSSFSSIKDLSSSLHHQDGLGLFYMASFYTGYMLACMFAYKILEQIDTRVAICCTTLCQIPFVISNIWPKFYVLLPLSFIGGISQALLWTATGCYLVWIVQLIKWSPQINNRVFSMFYLVASFSTVIGGLITPLFLSPYDELIQSHNGNLSMKSNSSILCGPDLCFTDDDLLHMYLSPVQRYTVVGYFAATMTVSSALFFFLMDSHQPIKTDKQNCTKCETILNISNVLCSKDFLVLIPIIFYYGFQMAFISGSFFKGYSGCQYGIDKVGYFIAIFGSSSAISSGVSGAVESISGRNCFLIFACLADITALVGMMLWNLSTNIILTVALCSIWGIAHGIWQTNLNGLMGEKFAESAELAFSSFNLILSVGLVTGYSYAHFVCVRTKLYVTGAICLISTVSYLISSFCVRCDEKHTITINKDNDNKLFITKL